MNTETRQKDYNLKKHLEILGKRVTDRITGYKGVATSVCFDLYGCIQVIINPGMNEQGALQDPIWFDFNRLEVSDESPVMIPPNWDYGNYAEGNSGPEVKPSMKMSGKNFY